MRWRGRWGGVAVLVLAAFGCGGADRPVKVRGTVTLVGVPVEGAVVTFLAEAGGRNASGRTRADGSFELTTFAANDGALPGNYTVLVEYTAPPEVAREGLSQQEAMDAIQKAAR